MKLAADARGGTVIDATATMYPSRLEVVEGAARVGQPTSTTFGYVVRGSARIRAPGLELTGDAGTWFAVPDTVELDARGSTVVIERFGFRGMLAAGRIEEVGRLSYIDGCSDTVLCMPPRLGDPVLNHLHFPVCVTQTLHLHPSIRLGVVARGSGTAFGPGRGGKGWELPLSEGAVFLLEAHEVHAFRTDATSLDVIAFHPDSDWGPTDAVHPMLNRTYLRRHET
jgi:hypothetical protein